MKPVDDVRTVSAAYDAWSESYDSQENRTRDLDAQVLRALPLSLESLQVLELGCGTGKNTEWLAQRASQVVALDFSGGMLAKARERVKANNVRFEQHDIQQTWPVPDGSQDLIVINLVLEHLEHLAPVFSEARRTLREGGRMFLCELHPFRQLQGAQANFSRGDGSAQRITAYQHDVADFVKGGLAAGLTLESLGEWRDPSAPPSSTPRLLSCLFRR